MGPFINRNEGTVHREKERGRQDQNGLMGKEKQEVLAGKQTSQRRELLVQGRRRPTRAAKVRRRSETARESGKPLICNQGTKRANEDPGKAGREVKHHGGGAPHP